MSAETLAGAAARESVRWLSPNPSKAWGEKFFLAYTPFWIAGMATLMQIDAGARWDDGLMLAAHLVLFAPAWVVPALVRDERDLGRPWYRTYWFKLNVWIGVFSFIGSYWGSEYFFDVLGMVYSFDRLHWTMDSALLGSGTQVVPVIMYFSAHYYFLTYHTCSVIVMRRVRTSRLNVAPAVVWPLTILLTAYFFAWAETFFMTNEAIAEQFTYQDVPRMLKWGSLVYGCYFFVSFPMVYRLDEAPETNWTVGRTVIDALAAGMLVLFLLDLAARVIGTL